MKLRCLSVVVRAPLPRLASFKKNLPKKSSILIIQIVIDVKIRDVFTYADLCYCLALVFRENIKGVTYVGLGHVPSKILTYL